MYLSSKSPTTFVISACVVLWYKLRKQLSGFSKQVFIFGSLPTSLSPFLLKSSRECRHGISFISYGAPQGVSCQDLVYVGKPLCEGFVSRENVFAPELFVLISLLFIFFFFFIKFRFEANARCFIVVKNFILFIFKIYGFVSCIHNSSFFITCIM